MGEPNPSYGSGVFRRCLRWRATAGEVEVELEDSNHGFRLRLRHDGCRIVDLAVDPVRYPFTTCPEASRAVERIVGASVADAVKLRECLPGGENCTHMVDMALMAAAHAGDVGVERLYDIAVADERDGVTEARIECDGELLYEWRVRANLIESPAALAGRPLMRGFYAWAAEAFGGGKALEAAQALQRGFFVAQARRYRYAPVERYPAMTDGMPTGSCYSYNTGAVERALRIRGSVRDDSDSSARLLHFVANPESAAVTP
jgi:hypothetical protein